MINLCWLLRNNYPKKHATSNRNITAYDRGLYLQVEIVFGKYHLLEDIFSFHMHLYSDHRLRVFSDNCFVITKNKDHKNKIHMEFVWWSQDIPIFTKFILMIGCVMKNQWFCSRTRLFHWCLKFKNDTKSVIKSYF